MKKTSASTISNLPIIALAIIFSLSTLLITSCGSGNSDKPATTQVDSTKASLVDSTKASYKILGTWVRVDDPVEKGVFTADSMTEIRGERPPITYKYNWINEQEIEFTIPKTLIKAPDTVNIIKAKITIDGDSLTMSFKGDYRKFIRQGE